MDPQNNRRNTLPFFFSRYHSRGREGFLLLIQWEEYHTCACDVVLRLGKYAKPFLDPLGTLSLSLLRRFHDWKGSISPSSSNISLPLSFPRPNVK